MIHFVSSNPEAASVGGGALLMLFIGLGIITRS